MALQTKCDLYLNNNEIVIADSTGFYNPNNLTGWSHPSMNGGSPLTASVIDGSLNVLIESIILEIDGVVITIASGVNEAILPAGLEYLTSPNDLVFTINQYTYSSYYPDFADFTDGIHEVSYTIEFTAASGLSSVTYESSVFTYKEAEAKMWDIFHSIAYNHNTGGVDRTYLEKALYAYAIYKGLEYSTRTSTNQSKSLEILSTLNKVLDFKNSLSS